MLRYWIIAAIVLLSLDLGVGRWWFLNRKEKRFDAQILSASSRYGVDPSLVKAVVWKESNFDPDARGTAGEVGLMQIRALAAQEWATSEKLRSVSEYDLTDPETNTLAGTWYLSKLLRRYRHTDNPLPYALADYNAGRGNVLKWLSGAALTNHAAFIEQIGFPSTKQYVHLVGEKLVRYRATKTPPRDR